MNRLSGLVSRRGFAVELGAAVVAFMLVGAIALAAKPAPEGAGKVKADRTATKQADKEDRKAEKEADEAGEKEGVHGGPKERFHDASACNLTDVSKLEGNWTHGDYVRAVAAGGDSAKTKEAAQSRCGKPIKAEGRGNGKAKGHED